MQIEGLPQPENPTLDRRHHSVGQRETRTQSSAKSPVSISLAQPEQGPRQSLSADHNGRHHIIKNHDGGGIGSHFMT